MKPNATPRQMRDGNWTLGSVSYSSSPWRAVDIAVACIAVSALALIVAGVI